MALGYEWAEHFRASDPMVIIFAFVIISITAGFQLALVHLITGTWGGTDNDPLWVGPLSAGLSVLSTIVVIVYAKALSDSWRSE